MVDLVERLRNIESADARCTALTDNIIIILLEALDVFATVANLGNADNNVVR